MHKIGIDFTGYFDKKLDVSFPSLFYDFGTGGGINALSKVYNTLRGNVPVSHSVIASKADNTINRFNTILNHTDLMPEALYHERKIVSNDHIYNAYINRLKHLIGKRNRNTNTFADSIINNIDGAIDNISNFNPNTFINNSKNMVNNAYDSSKKTFNNLLKMFKQNK